MVVSFSNPEAYRPGVLCPDNSSEDGESLVNPDNTPEGNIAAIEQYITALLKKLKADIEDTLPKVEEPKQDRKKEARAPHNPPKQPDELPEEPKPPPVLFTKEAPKSKLVDAETQTEPEQLSTNSSANNTNITYVTNNYYNNTTVNQSPEIKTEEQEPEKLELEKETIKHKTKAILQEWHTTEKSKLYTPTAPKIEPNNNLSKQKVQAEHDFVRRAQQMQQKQEIQKNNETVDNPEIMILGSEKFIKSFFDKQGQQIKTFQQIYDQVKDKPEVIESLKEILDRFEKIKKNSLKIKTTQVAQIKTRHKILKAANQKKLTEEILKLKVIADSKYKSDQKLNEMVDYLVNNHKKASNILYLLNNAIMSGQLNITHENNVVKINNTEGEGVCEVKSKAPNSLNIESSKPEPTNETLTQMIAYAQQALLEIGDEEKKFTIIDCENYPIAAIKLYLLGKAVGLNPVYKETANDPTKIALNQWLSTYDNLSESEKELIDIYQELKNNNNKPDILEKQDCKELLKKIEKWRDTYEPKKQHSEYVTKTVESTTESTTNKKPF